MRARWSKVLLVLIGLAWGAYFLAGKATASFLAQKFGPIINRAAKGKIADPVIFLHARAGEALFLLTVGVVLVLVARVLFHWLRQRGLREPWVWQCIITFVLLNLWLVVAMQTAVFWAAMFTGSSTANYTQFRFKQNLLRENPADKIILLMGSSQTQAQLDENVMNEQLRGEAWTTELHFPGSAGLDKLLALRRMENVRGDVIIVYLSENSFYTRIHVEAPPMFARLQDIPLLRKIGLKGELWEKPFGYGFFGQILPLFHAREALTHRVLGMGLAQSTQQAQDASLADDLAERAKDIAGRFVMDHTSDIQKRAFTEFLAIAGRQGRKVIMLEGQLNPLLARPMDPKLRADMKTYLREMTAKYSHVLLVPEEDLPPQSSEDYNDLTHVNHATQLEFTNWMVDYLRKSALF